MSDDEWSDDIIRWTEERDLPQISSAVAVTEALFRVLQSYRETSSEGISKQRRQLWDLYSNSNPLAGGFKDPCLMILLSSILIDFLNYFTEEDFYY
jgi:hypothetical protein